MTEINFDNSWIDNTKNFTSLTEVIQMITPEFDKDSIVDKTYNKHFNNPNSEYFQMSKEDIIKKWESKAATSRKYGSLLDKYIGIVYESEDPDTDMQLYELDNDVDSDERLKGLLESFKNCKHDFIDKLKFVAREKTVYYKVDDNNYITGRFDALFVNPDNDKYCVVDWKSSGKIDKVISPWTQYLYGPAKIYPNLNWYTYTIQTYFYKTALLNHYIDTTEDNVKTLVIDLPGKNIKGTSIDYDICTPAFKYSKELMDKIFKFAIMKKTLLNKKK